MEINLIKQVDDYGCIPACCAMVLGKSYEEVAADFKHDFSKKGIKDKKWIEYLAYEGFAVLKKSFKYVINRHGSNSELLKPFAPIHIVCFRQFTDAATAHAVVMDDSGKLYCPAGVSDADIRKNYIVEKVFGFFGGK